MDTTRFNVTISKAECVGLLRMAEDECRDPRDQVRYILRKELRRGGFLSADEQLKEEEDAELIDQAA